MFAPAKINWTLEVLCKRADGFHELRSWFLALDWGDELHFVPNPKLVQSTMQVEGPTAPGVPTDASNLVLKAEAQWRLAGGVAPHGCWQLHKTIPSGAGLGGGSSDAATALHLLQQVAKQPLSPEQCRAVAQSIGSDVDFFWQRQSAELRGGRGEIVLAAANPPELHLVLALSDLHASTPEVFANLKAGSMAAPSAENQKWPLQPGVNDLEAAAYQAVPGLQELGAQLNRAVDDLKPHSGFTMSGSGSSFFAACNSSAQANQLAGRIQPLVRQAVICRPLRYSSSSDSDHAATARK